MGADFPGPAEDIILAWMLGLGADRDPAQAARRLIETYGLAEAPLPSDATGRIVEMLRQTAEFPKERLAGQPRDRRRTPSRQRDR